MTRDEYEAKLRGMEALELDAEVATEVMKLKLAHNTGLVIPNDAVIWKDDTGKTIRQRYWSPSSNMSAAWEVVEKMGAYKLCSSQHRDGFHQATFWRKMCGFPIEADTAPRAICIAACLAVWEGE